MTKPLRMPLQPHGQAGVVCGCSCGCPAITLICRLSAWCNHNYSSSLLTAYFLEYRRPCTVLSTECMTHPMR